MLRGLNRLGDQRGDGHGPDSAGNGRIGGCAIDHRREFDVSHAAGMVAGIDDDGSVANPIGLDELGLADRAHEDFGAANHVGKILSA